MWPDFFFAVAALLVFLFLPGFLIAASAKRPFFESAAFSPIIAVAFYSLAAILYEKIGLASSWESLFLPFLMISILMSFLLRCYLRKEEKNGVKKWELYAIALYLLVATIVVGLFFVRNLDGADSFYQAFDNGSHLSTVRTFIDSGIYSSFATGYGNESPSPFDSGSSFYPAAWHCLAAMASPFAGSSVTVAANAVNFVSSAVVFPLSVLFALSVLFVNNRKAIFFGSLVVVGVAPFPWGFLTFGPLYPNLLSMAMFPAAVVPLIKLLSSHRTGKGHLPLFIAAVLSTIALFFSQPNSIFAELILIGPFVICECFFCHKEKHPNSFVSRVAILLLSVFVFLGLWFALYSLPVSMIRSVVEFNWPSTVGKWQAVIDCLLYSFNTGAAQPVVSVFVLIGSLKALSSKKTAWLVFSYAFSCVIYIASVSTDGLLKHVLSGFWYTDPYRLAATASIVSIPLVVIGIQWAVLAVDAVIVKLKDRPELAVNRKIVHVSLFLMIMTALYSPNFLFAGCGNVLTAFGNIGQKVETENNAFADKVLTHDEMEFAKRALQEVPSNELILNEPNDGSGFLYALFDAKNIYYKRFNLPSAGENPDSILIRSSLDTLSTNSEVAEAVRGIGAKYVLLLDQGGDPEKRVHFWSYYPEQWVGFSRITDETSGFKVVMAEGDMRLYEIVD